jgi:hypothetical protein
MMQASSSGERPIPMRQWTAIRLPSPNRSASDRASFHVSFGDVGDVAVGDRVGDELHPVARASSPRVPGRASLLLAREHRDEDVDAVLLERPDLSSSQSPPRGRGMTASLPGPAAWIQ